MVDRMGAFIGRARSVTSRAFYVRIPTTAGRSRVSPSRIEFPFINDRLAHWPCEKTKTLVPISQIVV